MVLLQRSEGGALGIGGGGGGGFLTGRGTANLLTRTTAGLAAAFFTTSILLTLVAQHTAPSRSIFDGAPGATAPATTAPGDRTGSRRRRRRPTAAAAAFSTSCSSRRSAEPLRPTGDIAGQPGACVSC